MEKEGRDIISRRDIKPLLIKAQKTAEFYAKASGCTAAVVDSSGHALSHPEYFNTEIHRKALERSHCAGSSYVYACEKGFVYWTSPIYTAGRYAGAIIAGHVRGKNPDEVKSLARILLLAAERISDPSRDSMTAIDRLAKKKHPEAILHGYSLDRERLLLAALRRGDNEKSRKMLNSLLGSIHASQAVNIEQLRFRAMELVILLSRETAEPYDTMVALEMNNRYLKRLQESETPEDLKENLHLITEDLSAKIFSFQGIRHASALRRAERFIWENYTRKISLKEIADASGLSAPYFSTIFKDEMGENLSVYLNRLRVEKAAVMLTETGLSLRNISGACGFEDQSWFSKIFKIYAGMSPGKYRKNGGGHILS
ncbi:helix-turn-helix domain-containing protein [Leadbettera azotonutricia]|uniref:Putative transcriptional regulator n=1 Tax=Leadbettera azotonutricia (strain ATCC BAA-888 / DSM 13862 / ZAS-9) TaxID=545695 RepID=F5YE03_LEAAZ|nr:helix-turn-helix domain-containing protein [Leadbettera azotonutricia]AEF82055.1 putative transcriptional regulator [Leadbettera azotonutricia ZAS-9]